MTCLVSGGADSTCLWHALRDARLRRLRRSRSPRRARCRRRCRCRALCDVDGRPRDPRRAGRDRGCDARAPLRGHRRAAGLRATGHTATDQIETVLYRIVSSGSTRGIRVRREDGVVRPLLDRHARGDRGVLRGARSPRTRRCDEPRDGPGPDPGGDPAAPPTTPSGRRGEPARARRGAPVTPAGARSVARRAALVAGGLPVGRPRKRRSGRPRVRHATARRHARVGPLDARGRAGRSRGAHAPTGGSSGRAPQESAGSPRGRESAEGRAGDVADRRVRRRGRRRPRDRSGAGLGRRRRSEEEAVE